MNIHVAIFSCPVPALVHPHLSVVSCLVRRGYRVTYVTSERFAAEVTSLGAEVVRCPRVESPFNQDDDAGMPIEHQYVRNVVSLASRTFTLAWPFYKKNRPDLVIYDLVAFAGVLLADKCGVPALRMSNQFDFTEATLRSQEIPDQWREKQLELRDEVKRFFVSQGSSRGDVFLDNEDRTFYFYLRELQLGTIRERDFYAARCVGERPNVAPWKSPTTTDRPRALVASSTTYNRDVRYYERILAALARDGWETTVANMAAKDFSSLQPSCQFVQNVPLAAIMPHVSLLICGAGLATAMEAAYHGLPMLMLSGGHVELEAYAQKFQTRGLGMHLRASDASPDDVVECAMRMLENAELRAAVGRLRDAVRRSAGAEEVVNWIESRDR